MESSTGVRSGFATSSASARAAAAAAVSRSTSGETMLANELGAAGVEDDTIPATSIAPTPAVYAASSAVGRIGGRAPASDAAAGDATDSDQGHSAGGGRSTPHQPVSIRRHRTRVDRSDTPTSLAVPSAVQVALESGDEDDSDDGDGGVDDMGRVEGVGGFLRPSRSNSDWSAGAKGVSLDLEVAGVSPVPGHSASHGKGSRWNLKRSSTSFAWDRTFAVDESGAAGSAEGRRSPAGRVASSRAAQRQLLSALDPSAEEVKRSNTVSVGGYTVFTRSKRIRSFNVVRQTYKTQMEARRKNVGHSDALLAFLLVLIDVRVYYDLLLRLLMSTSRVVLFMILDVISDCLFCVLYVVDLQWAVAHDGDDAFQTLDLPHRWLWINRRVETFDIALAFSVFNLLSLLCRVALDDSKLKTIFSVTTFIDVITSLPFVVASGFRVGQYIYLPFFLRGAIIVSRFKQVLRLRGATSLLNFDAVKEKVVILLVTMLSIIYVGTCAFQFTEFRFGSNAANNDFYQCIYFIVVTLSTVGYGDVTASSQYGRVVTIIIILVTISILPNLISSLAASISSQSSNGGSYKVGRTPFVVVMGEFDTVPKLLDVMETFLDEEQGDQAVTLVFLARNPPTPGVKNLVQQSLYRGRVHFLVGSGTEADDFERAQIRHASAVYLIADRGASDAEIEDERNTLCAFAIDDFAPQTPLYISNLRPDAESFQESTATAVICVEDLKQFILGLTTLYSGAANLLINLLHKYAPPSSFDEAWMAQYGDGLGNELYSRASNPAFAGRPFSELAWYLFREFQVILIGVKAQVEEYDEGVHLLNPGPSYLIKEGDTLLLIAQSPAEVNSIASLSKEEFLASVKMERDEFYYDYGTIRTSPRPSKHENSLSRQRPPAATPSTAAAPTPTTTPLTHVTQPNVSFLDSRVPLCHVLDRRARAEDVVVRTAAHFSDHVLVCTASLDVFKFVATLRAAHLKDELRPIVFLTKREPTAREVKTLSIFQDVYVVVGDPRHKSDLVRGGILGASKVVILSQRAGGAQGDIGGGETIMASHLIYSYLKSQRVNKCIIVELPKRAQIKYLRPTHQTALVTGASSGGGSGANSDGPVGVGKRRRNGAPRTAEHTVVASTRADEGLDYMYMPLFSAGRVVVAAMLDTILFQLLKNPSMLDVFKLFCGVRTKREQGLERSLGVEPAFLCQIYVPSALVGKTFGELFKELSLNNGLVPLGIYRDAHVADGNALPFVFTNPLASVVMRESDLVFALSP